MRQLTGTNVVSVVTHNSAGTTEINRFGVPVTGSSPTTLSYDINGNTTTDENGNTYKWDALNRLTEIDYFGSAKSLFAYDGLSRRTQIVEKDSSGTVTSTKNYIWVGQEIAEERDASNTVTKRFFPQGEQQSGTAYYEFLDHEGSVHEMMDGSGNLVSRLSFDPYGRMTVVYGTNLPSKQYAQLFYLPASGLDAGTWRIYKPNTGTFPNHDPISERGGINLYSYTENNPIDRIDPLGLTYASNAAFLWDFLTGGGSNNRFYGPDTIQTREMARSPGANNLRQFFYKKGCQDVTHYDYGTGHAARDTLLNPATASWGSTAAQVGGWGPASAINNGK